MGFTKTDRSQIESLLGKVTTTMDAVGRSMRDAHLVRLLNPYLPSEIIASLQSVEDKMGAILRDYAVLEEDVIVAMRRIEAAEPK